MNKVIRIRFGVVYVINDCIYFKITFVCHQYTNIILSTYVFIDLHDILLIVAAHGFSVGA